MPEFSVISLTHNKLAYSRRCLGSLLHSTGADWELIVVDNGSSDGTPAWLETLPAQAAPHGVAVKTLRNAGNIGCSTARNQGIAAASGRYLVFVDNDVALRTADWLPRLRDVLTTEPRAGMVGPRIVYPFPPYDIQCAGVGISPRGRVLFRGRGASRTDPDYARPRDVQCLISACLMVRASLIDQYGGFDEHFNPVEFEDFDLCYRLREQGWSARYTPTVEMYHFESVTTQGTDSIPNPALVIRNGLKFKSRWRHCFAHEAGPPDNATRWRKLPTRYLADVGELPILETHP